MRGITDHPDDFDREWAYRRGYAHSAEAGSGGASASFARRNQAQSGSVACL